VTGAAQYGRACQRVFLSRSGESVHERNSVCCNSLLTLESVPTSTILSVRDVSNKDYLSSGQLAELAGVSTDTLRYYERQRVLPRPRRGANGYRQYPAEALQRVQLVRRALSIGFTLDELSRILKVRDDGGAPCEEVRSLAAQKLSNIETQLRDLTALRNDLRLTLKHWDARLARRTKSERIGLLESLSLRNHNRPRVRLTAQLKPKKL